MSDDHATRSRARGPLVAPLPGPVLVGPVLVGPVLVGLVLVGLVLAAATLVATPAGGSASPGSGTPLTAALGVASRVDDTAARWAGFRIPRTGRADGGWIGGYRVGTDPVFVTTPGRRPNRAGFQDVQPTSDLAGRRGATRRETARAAWVLSKYGGYRDATQAAAVDAAVLHLLAGGRWQVGGRRGAARIRATGDARTVRRFANVMLRQSRVSAGRYAATVSASSADVGGVTSVTVRVEDGHGGPVAGLPVTVTSPDGGASVPAAGPVDAVTGDDGRAVVRLAAPLAGWRTVTARVTEVPEHRLLVRPPDRRRQASAAQGGARRSLVVSTQAAVRGPQTLTLRAVHETIAVGEQAVVAAAVRGDGTPRGVAGALHGPFGAASAAECSGPSVGAVTTTVAADGTYLLPALAPAVGGFYAWSVALDAAPTGLPATACGAVVKVKGRTAVSLVAPTGLPSRGNARVTVTLSGMPVQEKVDLTLKLYGGAGCQTLLRTEELSVLGNGQIESGPIWLEPGSYTWRAEAAPGDLWLGSESACGASGTTTQVG